MTLPITNRTFRPLPDSYRKLASLFGAATAALGLLGLLGWILRMPLLSSIRSSYIPMAPLTAIALICLGGLLLVHSMGPSRGPVGILAAMVSALLSAYGLIEFVEGLEIPVLSLEEWLFPNPPMIGAISTGRMSPTTAVLLLLSGAIVPMLFLRERGGERQKLFGDLAGCLGILVAMAGTVVVLSYLHETPFLYGTSTIPMAATTAIAFLLLGAGQILAVGPDGFPSRPFVGPSARARLLRTFVSTTLGVVLAIALLYVYARGIFEGSSFIFGISATVFAVIAGALIARVAFKVGDDMDRSEEVRRGMEDTLQKQFHFLQVILNAIPAPVFYKDARGFFLGCNKAYEEYIGLPKDCLVEKTVCDIAPKDLSDVYRDADDALFRKGGSQVYETKMVPADGKRHYVIFNKATFSNPDGSLGGLVGTILDITERKRAEEALRESEDRFRDLVEHSQDLICTHDLKGRILSANPWAATVLGYAPDELLRMNFRDLLVPEMRHEFGRYLDEIRAHGTARGLMWVQTRNGERRFWEYKNTLRTEGVAEPIVRGMAQDITERKLAEEEIKVLAKFPSENPDPIMRISTDGTLLYMNESGSGQLSEWNLQVGKITSPLLRDAVSQALNDGSRKMLDLEYGERVYSFSVSPVRDAGYANLYGRNITERKQSEQALKESEEKFRVIFDGSKDGIILADVESRKFHTANNTFCDMLQYTLDEIRQLGVVDIHPEECLSRVYDAFEKTMKQGSELSDNIPVRRKDGSIFWAEIKSSPVSISGKNFMLGNFRDVTERRKAEETLARLGMAVDQATEGIVITDREGTILYVNPAFERISGYSREDAIGKNPRILRSGKQDKSLYREIWGALEGGEVWTGHLINRRKDGSLYEEDATISPVRDSSGNIVSFVAVMRDITQLLSLEKQVRMAQKMEAVGTLAGGIAHDFNNALTGIFGFGDLLRERFAGNEQALHDLDEIQRCAERAATLTRQLLTFARRQVIEPVHLNLSALVADLMKLIGKVVGEHIEVKTSLGKDVPTIHADRGQIEQVVMNLCLNARDAMPEGGRLVVETGNVFLEEEDVRRNPYMKTGRYALLTVSDTGVGMDEKIRSRVFEPFFTTKGPDKGTGLGLAMVYGIVKQHGGFINLYSEPGKGTAFKVYFPAIEAQPDAVPAIRREESVRGGTETILLAEDDEAIRELAERILTGFGYTVLVARNGEDAIGIFRQHKEIVLAVLDVVMPRKGGKEAFDEMHKQNPGLKVIFMSGYSADGIHDSFVLTPGTPFLQKPFGPTILARKVREVLDTQ